MVTNANYREIRLTCHVERGGRVSYRIHAKPHNVEWNVRHLLVADSLMRDDVASLTPEDVYHILADVLAEQFLPESHERF